MYTAYISLSRCQICIYHLSFSESLFFSPYYFFDDILWSTKFYLLVKFTVYFFFKIFIVSIFWGVTSKGSRYNLRSQNIYPMFSSKKFLVLALKFGILIQFWLFLHMEWCRDPVLTFCMLFQHCFVEETIISPWIICWHPFQRWIDCQCEDVFLDSRLTQLISTFVLMPTHTVSITVTWK